MVDNAFVPPLTDDVMAERATRRMRRIDRHGGEYSAVDGPGWSASGAVRE